MIVPIRLSQLCAHGPPMQNTVFQVKNLKAQSYCGWRRYQPNLIIFQISFMGMGTQLLQLVPMRFCEKWENSSTLKCSPKPKSQNKFLEIDSLNFFFVMRKLYRIVIPKKILYYTFENIMNGIFSGYFWKISR